MHEDMNGRDICAKTRFNPGHDEVRDHLKAGYCFAATFCLP